MAIKQPVQQEICSVRYQELLMQHAQGFYTLQEQVKFDLSNSNTEAYRLSDLFEGQSPDQAFLNLQLNYSAPQGEQSLLQAIADLYQGISADQILVEEGSEEGLLLLLQCLLAPNDHLIIQYPTYPPALEMAVNRNERNVSLWEGKVKDGEWQWDLAELEALCQESTKAIFLCQPHNPTGAVMPDGQYQALIEFSKSRNLLLICDEVYRFLEYDHNILKKPIVECYEKGISIGSLSKAFALPGLRTGWVAIRDEELRSKLISYKSRTTLCNSIVTQYLAKKALAKKESILNETHSLVAGNMVLLKEFVASHQHLFEWVPPKAGTVAFLALKSRRNAEAFCVDLAKNASVLCLPGAIFSYEPHYFRIGFGRKHFGEALQAMEYYIKML